MSSVRDDSVNLEIVLPLGVVSLSLKDGPLFLFYKKINPDTNLRRSAQD